MGAGVGTEVRDTASKATCSTRALLPRGCKPGSTPGAATTLSLSWLFYPRALFGASSCPVLRST
jgi:hypothetical protein